jgi:surfeit locus 1 family protein
LGEREVKNWRWWLIALVFISLFSGLSYWQFQRGAQKEQMLESYQQTLSNKQTIPVQTAILQKQSLQWVSAEGKFLELPPIFLDNQRREDQVGVRVYRAFETFERQTFLVDLGWLPLSGDRRFPQIPNYPNSSLSGLWTKPPSVGLALGPALSHQSTHVLAMRMETDELARLLNVKLEANVLRLGPEADIGFERSIELLPNTLPPEKHRGYAVQWAGLAIATFIIALILQFRKRKSDEFSV